MIYALHMIYASHMIYPAGYEGIISLAALPPPPFLREAEKIHGGI